jgi:hypothetical protein
MRRSACSSWAMAALFGAVSVLAACGSDVETIGPGGGTGGTGASGAHGGSGGGTGGTGNIGAGGDAGGPHAGAGGGVLPTGDCNGPEDCGGNPCVEITPGGWRSCTDTVLEATSCTTPQDECCTTADCAHGLCLQAPLVPYCGGPQPLEYNACATDECQDDSPCSGPGYDGVCLPAPMLGRKIRACMTVSCRVNADCTTEPGGICAPVDDPCCGQVSGLYCVYPSNGCRPNAVCRGGFCQRAAAGAHCEPGGPICPA